MQETILQGGAAWCFSSAANFLWSVDLLTTECDPKRGAQQTVKVSRGQREWGGAPLSSLLMAWVSHRSWKPRSTSEIWMQYFILTHQKVYSNNKQIGSSEACLTSWWSYSVLRLIRQHVLRGMIKRMIKRSLGGNTSKVRSCLSKCTVNTSCFEVWRLRHSTRSCTVPSLGNRPQLYSCSLRIV